MYFVLLTSHHYFLVSSCSKIITSKLNLPYHICCYILFKFFSSWKSDIQFNIFILNHPKKIQRIWIYFIFFKHTCTIFAAAAAKSLQSCLTLYDPINGSPPSSSVLGIPQTRTLEWVASSFSNAWKWKVKVKSFNVSNPMDCSLPGSSVHGISQARVLEWVAISCYIESITNT